MEKYNFFRELLVTFDNHPNCMFFLAVQNQFVLAICWWCYFGCFSKECFCCCCRSCSIAVLVFQRSRHGRTFLGLGGGQRTARMASSKTVFSPFCVRAEHSRYLTAPTSLAIERPWKYIDSVRLKKPHLKNFKQITFIFKTIKSSPTKRKQERVQNVNTHTHSLTRIA